MKVEVYFEEHKEVIKGELLKATSDIYIAVAWINFKEYYKIFNNVLDKNVELNIICSDNPQNRSHQSEIDLLSDKGAKIKLLALPSGRNHMHHKFVVIDDMTLLNGSFNWSPNAAKSIENIMVIRSCEKIVINSFRSEFAKLLHLDKNYLYSLQKKTRCEEKGCSGELLNVLIFSRKSSKYHETCGDIVKVCSCCEEYIKPKECISDSHLEVLLDTYRSCDSEEECCNIYYFIEENMNSYIEENNIVIHAIGRVQHILDYNDDDCIETQILWRNKFVGNRLPDKLDSGFDVNYDNYYEL